jgi:hypothetical protein
MKLHEFKAKIEALHDVAEKRRFATDDFYYKNVLAAEEAAYEKVLHLLKDLVV